MRAPVPSARIRRASPSLAAVALAVMAVGLAACGARHLVLSVDVLSFISPSDRSASFGLPAPSPVAITQTVPVVQQQQVTLFQGLADLTSNPSVVVDGTVVLEGQGNPTNGIVDSADAVVKVYVSATGTNPRSTLPLVTPPLHVVEGRVDTVHVTLMAANSTEAARVAELITQHTVLVAVDLVATIPAQAEPRGTVTLTALRATVTAERRQL